MENIKTALVCHGGGMKAAFAAGVLYQMAEDLGIKKVDIIMGMSASAPTIAYYSAGQISVIKKIWQNELGTPKFVKMSRIFQGRPIFNLNYLIEEIFKNKYPLNTQALESSATQLFIPIYNYQKDFLEYYGNRQSDLAIDVWRAIKMTMTIHHEQIIIEDNLDRYVDPALVSPLVYKKAVEAGATHFIIVSNNQQLHWTFKENIGFLLFKIFQSRKFPQEVREKLKTRKELVNSSYEDFMNFCEANNVLLIQPPAKSKINPVMTKNRQIQKAFNLGIKEIEKEKDNEIIKIFQRRSQAL